MKDTKDSSYTTRLEKSTKGIRAIVDVQLPYRRHLKRLNLSEVLDVGCGIGRNLDNLAKIGVPALGVDHNIHSVEAARARGFSALTLDEFSSRTDEFDEHFSSILISHVLEHMTKEEASDLVKHYSPFLKPGGRIVIITPQEAGFRSDPTHVDFMDNEVVGSIIKEAGLNFQSGYSFPFPRIFGHVFLYNEFVTLGYK